MGDQTFFDLQRELQRLGYHEYQLKSIYKEAIGRSDVSRMSAQEEAQLVEKMQEYVAFANSCLNSTK